MHGERAGEKENRSQGCMRGGEEERDGKRKEKEKGGREEGKKEDSDGDREGQRSPLAPPCSHTYSFSFFLLPGLMSVCMCLTSSESPQTAASKHLLLCFPHKAPGQCPCCWQVNRQTPGTRAGDAV